jgi:hypothetical protein
MSFTVIRASRLWPGLVVQARIAWGAGIADAKVRPCVIRSAKGNVVALHPCYSRQRAGYLEVTRTGYRCWLSPHPVEVDISDVLHVDDRYASEEVCEALGFTQDFKYPIDREPSIT